MALHLGLDHVRGVRPRVVRAEHERDVVGLLEALQQRGQPAVVRRRRVLGEERDVVARGELHHPVARAAVGELAPWGSRWMRAPWRSAISSEPSVEPGVDDQQLDLAVGALRAHGGEHLVEVARPVVDGDGDRSRRRSSVRALVELARTLTASALARAQRRGELPGDGASHLRGERLVVLDLAPLGAQPLVAPPTAARARRRAPPRGPRRCAGSQSCSSWSLAHRSSAIRGASRLNTHRPSANVTTTIAAGDQQPPGAADRVPARAARSGRRPRGASR